MKKAAAPKADAAKPAAKKAVAAKAVKPAKKETAVAPVAAPAKKAGKPDSASAKSAKATPTVTAKASPKAAVKKVASKTPAALPATIVVKYDAGWGNSLHVRGEGPGLFWTSGAPLCSVGHDEWVWVAPAAGAVTFKVLLNDHAWATGENLVVAPGETVTIRPVF